MHRRTTIALVLATLFAMSGCIGFPGANTPTPGSTPTPVDTTPLVDGGADDYPHDVIVENSLSEEVSLTITAYHGSDVLYLANHTVRAGADNTVAGITEETLPEGERQLRFTASDDRDGSATVTVTVTDCLGDVLLYYEEGDLQATYSIC